MTAFLRSVMFAYTREHTGTIRAALFLSPAFGTGTTTTKTLILTHTATEPEVGIILVKVGGRACWTNLYADLLRLTARLKSSHALLKFASPLQQVVRAKPLGR